jgi:hypothetical protein
VSVPLCVYVCLVMAGGVVLSVGARLGQRRLCTQGTMRMHARPKRAAANTHFYLCAFLSLSLSFSFSLM